MFRIIYEIIHSNKKRVITLVRTCGVHKRRPVDNFTWGSSKELKELIQLVGEERSLIGRSTDPVEVEVGGLHQVVSELRLVISVVKSR
jgi:hypothetical protein